ncbi:MAG: BON domain-containing protein, partial [Pirellulaceae bacterium]
SPYPGIRELVCLMADADLPVRGQVGSFYLKQIALASLKNLAGIRRVVDQITVRNSSNAR